MIRTDLNQYDFHTINVHLDTNTNEWRADWHTMDELVPIIGENTFPNIAWIIKDVEQRVAEKGYVLASFQCTCTACQGEPVTPVQAFIERMYTRRNEAIIGLTHETYQKLIDTAEKHQASYGEDNIAELIEYLDGLAEHPDLHPRAVAIVKFQANDLQRRLENRMSREADEQSQRQAEQQALFAQQ